MLSCPLPPTPGEVKALFIALCYQQDKKVVLHYSRQFGEYLRLAGIRHVIASPYHPQTNGKIERYHRTIKGEIKLIPYEMPSELTEAIKAFIEYYNYRRYHEGLGDVTPYNIYTGRHLKILQSRKEAKDRTLQTRRGYNRVVWEQDSGLWLLMLE